MINILTVVGARPQFVKAAVISRLIRSAGYRDRVSEILVHTGQHYDSNMSDVFFDEMKIPSPDVNLGIGGGTHGKMTGDMLAGLEALIMERKPNLVLVYGDTNSTLAGALAASKLHVRVAHVEAGLRSYDKSMPEEQNRVIADHLSTWLFCPTRTAVENLAHEGIPGAQADGRGVGSDVVRPPAIKASANVPLVIESGDVMLDASLYYRELGRNRPEAEKARARLGINGPYRLLTLHRAENTDDQARLSSIVKALNAASDQTIVFPVHPRTRKALASQGLVFAPHVRLVEPVGYFDMIDLESSASCIITDSGGVQKEAYFFGVPCVTLRDSTEWVETIETGWNRLAGADVEAIGEVIRRATPGREGLSLYGDGDAGRKILDKLLETA